MIFRASAGYRFFVCIEFPSIFIKQSVSLNSGDAWFDRSELVELLVGGIDQNFVRFRFFALFGRGGFGVISPFYFLLGLLIDLLDSLTVRSIV